MRRMKDSGIEWIGEIPENWEIIRLKALFDFAKGVP
jgi:type I restriction enzyme S subunit